MGELTAFLRPLGDLRGLRNAVSSPIGVWGGAPSEIEFGVLQS